MYLIDTNVLSETYKRKPNQRVIDWFQTVDSASLYTSVLNVGEIRKGALKLQPESRKSSINIWLDEVLCHWFSNRILGIDTRVAEQWACLEAFASQKLSTVDTLLAATALAHKLSVVTRNVKDFQFEGLTVVNPWESCA